MKTKHNDTGLRASQAEMDLLHAQVAHTLKNALNHEWRDKDTGDPSPPPAALLTVAVSFLRNNGIMGAAVNDTVTINDYLGDAQLPFLDSELREIVDNARH